jgi:hypothetical protein|nr:MAG TPA: hypothetical protein [Caudoviricetes sp.]
MYTNSNITIYNKYFDKATRTDKYQRTILYGVFWDCKKAVNRIQSGLENADEAFIAIPFVVDSGKKYIVPKEFEKLDDKTGYFTLQEGDRVVQGEIDFEVTGKLSDLDKQYEAFTITSVDTKNFGSPHMRHWEVGAK